MCINDDIVFIESVYSCKLMLNKIFVKIFKIKCKALPGDPTTTTESFIQGYPHRIRLY